MMKSSNSKVRNNFWVLCLAFSLLVVVMVGRTGLTALAAPQLDQVDGLYDCTSQAEIPQVECEALLTTFRDTAGSSWNVKTDWLISTTPCSWYGISCTSGHATSLSLPANNLFGSLPAALGSLSSLQTLDLSGNRLSGSVPAELGSLASLTNLDMSSNQLSGDLPAALSNLSSLTSLDISYNRLNASDTGLLAFLNTLSPGWADTQTMAPANLQVTNNKSDNLQLSWTPIAYTADAGYYELSWSTSIDGTYTFLANTVDKSTTQHGPVNFIPGTYYFRIRTFTPAHNTQLVDLWSDYSLPISASIINPQPILDFVTPNHKDIGVAGFEMTVSGSHFITGSQVKWNGIALPTTVDSPVQLRATIPAQNLLSSGIKNITVYNPAPGGGTSTERIFTVSPISSSWSNRSPEGGTVNDIEIDPKNPLVMYITTEVAGIYKTVDGGQTWFPANKGIEGLGFCDIEISPINSNTIIAGGGSVYISKDGGKTWNQLPVNSGNSMLDVIKFDLVNPNVITIGTPSSLLQTRDGGLTWSSIGKYTDKYVLALGIDSTNPNIIYHLIEEQAGVHTLWKTVDNGAHWVKLDALPISISTFALDPNNPLILYAVTWLTTDSNTEQGIFKSTDGGATWAHVYTGSGLIDIEINPLDSNQVYISAMGGIYSTADAGIHWNFHSSAVAYQQVALTVSGVSSPHLFAGGVRGVVTSLDDGANWQKINSGLHAHEVKFLEYSDTNKLLWSATAWSGVWKSADFGANWDLVYEPGHLISFLMDPNDSNHLFINSYESVDGGNNWQARNVIPGAFTADSGLIAFNQDHIRKSIDGGVNWQEKAGKFPICVDSCRVDQFVPDPVNSDMIYAVAAQWSNNSKNPTALYKTSDGGNTWVTIEQNVENQYFSTLSVDPANPAVLYLATNTGLHKSTDRGATWTKIADMIKFAHGVITTIVVDPQDSKLLYVGGIGMSISLDGGLNWIDMSGGINPGLVWAIRPLHLASNGGIQSQATGNSRLFNISGGQVNAYFDNSGPTIKTIQLVNTNPSKALTVAFKLTFSEPVYGISLSAPFSDFSLTTTGLSKATIQSVTGSGNIYTVTVATGTGNGTIRLNIPTAATITDIVKHNLAGIPYLAGPSYTIAKSLEKNGNFETYPLAASKIPSSWTISNFSSTDGKYLSNKEGIYAILIKGSLNKTKKIFQTMTISGKTGDAFTLTYLVKASLLPTTGTCAAQVAFYNGVTLTAVKTLKCPTGPTYTWQKPTLSFTAPTPYTRLVLMFTYSKPSGSIWIDMLNIIKK